MTMYVAVYHWRIKPGREKEFEEFWKMGTPLFRDEQRGLGSRLHIADDGTYFAYAQWPDRETYFAKKNLSPAHRECLKKMSECILETFPTTLGNVTCDLLVRT